MDTIYNYDPLIARGETLPADSDGRVPSTSETDFAVESIAEIALYRFACAAMMETGPARRLSVIQRHLAASASTGMHLGVSSDVQPTRDRVVRFMTALLSDGV